MPRAMVVLREKVIDEAGNVLELAIWRVPVSARYPDGVRYRLAYLQRGKRAPTVLFDNHSPKGHHRHVRGIEEPYTFTGVDRLLTEFKAAVARSTEEPRWPGL